MTTVHEPLTPEERLRRLFADRAEGGVLVATSGGVDSCTLAAIAHQVLDEDMLAVTLDAESNAARELEDAKTFLQDQAIPHAVVDHSELSDPDYRENTPMRCYHCREGMLDRLREVAEDRGLAHIAMGYVPDDRMDHTPGRRAAKEAGAWFPYVDAGIGKDQVRALAERMDLPVADRPSNACLSSRIPYGREVTADKLETVEAAEQAVRSIADVEQVRVRHHDDVARIEVAPDQRAALLAHDRAITEELEQLGFTFVAVDLLGYRTGALNEALDG
jgi:uncharacterized protein